MKFAVAIVGLALLIGATSFDAAQFEKQVRSNDIVVLARVVEIRPSITTFWSGIAPCWQTVRYNVDEVLKGNVKERVIDVGHLIVDGSLTADKRDPVLSPVVFKPGNRLVLMFSSKPRADWAVCSGMGEPTSDVKRFCSYNENYGATLATNDVLALARKNVARN